MQNNSPPQLKPTFNLILIPVTVAFGLGIVWCRILEQYAYIFPAGAGIIALGTLLAHWLRCYRLAHFLLLPFFFQLGVLHAIPHCNPPREPAHIYNRISTKQLATITGRLQRAPLFVDTEDGTRTRLLIAVDSIRRPAGTFPDHNTATCKTFGLVQLTVNGRLPPDTEPGDLLLVKAFLRRVHSFSTPGSFNYQDFLANKAIWITGWIKNPVWIYKIHELPGAARLKTLRQLRFLPEKIRFRLAIFLDKTLPTQTAGLYKAILIGDKTDIPPEIIENFKVIGCMHILAISGMHMGLLALMLYSACSWLLKRSSWLILHIPVRKTAAAVSLIPLTGYALVAGFNTPVVRAWLMTSVLTMAVLYNRPRSIINSVSLAALLILMWNPTSLFTVSFQLSFAAVIVIATVYPKMIALYSSVQNRTNGGERKDNSPSQRIVQWLLAAILLSVTALAGTAPLLVHSFNRISLLSPITNILIEPLICLWSLTIGLAACSILPLAPTAATHLFHIGSWGLETSVWLASLFAKLPFSSLWLTTPSIAEIVLYYIILGCLLYFSNRPNRWLLGRIVPLSCLILLIGIPIVARTAMKMTSSTKVTVLDVAQGSATHIVLPGGKNILIDGGGPATARFNVGERLIAPYLWKNRIRRIDDIIISHPHADHYNGLFFIIKRFRPRTLWINGQPGPIPGYDRLLELARQFDMRINICRPGTTVCHGGDAAILCIANPLQKNIFTEIRTRTDNESNSTNFNNGSLVLKLVHQSGQQGISFLFPGDIGREEEDALLAFDRSAIDADILLAPHHGSGTSGSRSFLQAVSPDYIVISTGKPPGPKRTATHFKEFCRRHGTKLMTTAENGTISFRINGNSLSVESL